MKMSNENIKKEKLLISSCLMGEKVRYDGDDNLLDDIKILSDKYQLIPFCPEIASGMMVPRAKCEIKNINPLKIINEFGIDMTDFFIDGAKQTLHICINNNIKLALLKSKSPSCGNENIYDGTFTNQLIKGQGITANILFQNNIKVYNENQIGDLI